MSKPRKGNDHIRANHQEFIDAFQRARKVLGELDGVVNVGFGHKQIGGSFTTQVVITAFVDEKKPNEELRPEQRVPESFEGYGTDVRVIPTGQLMRCQDYARYERIKGGMEIETDGRFLIPGDDTGAGTLGCIVKKRGKGTEDRDNVYLLTCAHVLLANGAGPKDKVYQPRAPRSDPSANGRALGQIDDIADNTLNTPVLLAGATEPIEFYIDAGIARIDVDSKCCDSRCTQDVIVVDETMILELPHGGKLTDVRSLVYDATMTLPRPAEGQPDTLSTIGDNFPRVYKSGMRTGKTTGIIRSIQGTAKFRMHPADVDLTYCFNVLEIDFAPLSTERRAGLPVTRNCLGNKSFGEHGDSGSIVFDADNQAVGILFLRTDTDDPITFTTWACHIHPVLDTLKICVPTTVGTSHGTTNAIDGSGLIPSPTLGDFPPRDDGGILMSREVMASGNRAITAPIVTVSDAQREHMLTLLDTLRETERGRELHDTFAEVRREIGYLIRNCRPVKVAWHRHQGPAFLVEALNHLRGDAPAIPLEIRGVSRAMLIERMADVLSVHGSNPLAAAIARYRSDAPALATAATVDDLLSALTRDSSLGASA